MALDALIEPMDDDFGERPEEICRKTAPITPSSYCRYVHQQQTSQNLSDIRETLVVEVLFRRAARLRILHFNDLFNHSGGPALLGRLGPGCGQ